MHQRLTRPPTHPPIRPRALRAPLVIPALVLHGDRDVALGVKLLDGIEAAFDTQRGGEVEVKLLKDCSHWVQQVRACARVVEGPGARGRVWVAAKERVVLQSWWRLKPLLCCSFAYESHVVSRTASTPSLRRSCLLPQDYPLQVNAIMRDWLARQDQKKAS